MSKSKLVAPSPWLLVLSFVIGAIASAVGAAFWIAASLGVAVPGSVWACIYYSKNRKSVTEKLMDKVQNELDQQDSEDRCVPRCTNRTSDEMVAAAQASTAPVRSVPYSRPVPVVVHHHHDTGPDLLDVAIGSALVDSFSSSDGGSDSGGDCGGGDD